MMKIQNCIELDTDFVFSFLWLSDHRGETIVKRNGEFGERIIAKRACTFRDVSVDEVGTDTLRAKAFAVVNL